MRTRFALGCFAAGWLTLSGLVPTLAQAEEKKAEAKDAKKAEAKDEPKDAKAGDSKDAKADAKSDSKSDSKDEPDDKLRAKKKVKESEGFKDVARSSTDPKEDEGTTYYFAGVRYRHSFLPGGIVRLFVDGGPSTLSIPSFGIEGGLRKDGFDTILAITYADWSMNQFPFKGKGEAETNYELVTSKLKLINVTVDLMWSTDFTPNFSFQYGITTGLSLVFGDLNRVQAKPISGATVGDPSNLQPCAGKGDGPFCSGENDHYGDYSEPGWFSGGSKPNLYATFGPQLSFRMKPVKQFVARIDVGFNIFAGVFFGTGLNYGF